MVRRGAVVEEQRQLADPPGPLSPGFRALSDPLHQSGRQLLLWFEPQRVCRGTEWARSSAIAPAGSWSSARPRPRYKQHNMDWEIPHSDPRWVARESRRSQIAENDLLWNMGEPSARRFLTDWLSARIDEFGLDWYREDFNIAPLEYWQHADAADRQGITEIRYVEGLYAMWDELLRPASGPGHRQLCQRRPPHRPGNHRPQHGPLADRLARGRPPQAMPQLRAHSAGFRST